MEEKETNTSGNGAKEKKYLSFSSGFIAGTLVLLAGAGVVFLLKDSPNPVSPSANSSHSEKMLPENNNNYDMHAMMHTPVESESQYLSDMIPHHEEAIAKAKVLLEGTNRTEMKEFASSIIEVQSAEVEQMLNWLKERHPGTLPASDYMPMMRDYSGMTGDELDRAFLEDMIPHHMMAIMQSQSLLAQNLADHEDVIPFAKKVRDTQREEVLMMQKWLPEWFGQDAAYPMMGGMMGGGMGGGMMGESSDMTAGMSAGILP